MKFPVTSTEIVRLEIIRYQRQRLTWFH